MGGARITSHARLVGSRHFSTPRSGAVPAAGSRAERGRRYIDERRSLLAVACDVAGVARAYDADGGLKPEVADVYRRLRLEVIEESLATEVADDAALWARRGWPRDPRLAGVPEGRCAAWHVAYVEEARRLGLPETGPTGNDARRLALAILSVETGDPLAIQHVMDLRRAERREDAEVGGDVAELSALGGAHTEGRTNAADVDLANGGDADGVALEVRQARRAGCRNLFTDRRIVVSQAEVDERFRRQRMRWSSRRSRARADMSGHSCVDATGAEDQS